MWSALEAIATSLAATFAAVQILLSRQDANNRAVFEHLREIDKRVQDVWHASAEAAQNDLLDRYRGERDDLSVAARNYLALLNSIDLLCFASKKGLVNRKVADEYLQPLLDPNLVSLTFLREFQECCKDSAVYEHLVAHYAAFHRSGRSSRLHLPEA